MSQIIREDRPLPQKGKYRLARMHPKLNAEFLIINAKRDDLIKAYNHHGMIPNPAAAQINDEMREAIVTSGHLDKLPPKMIENPEWSVPDDKIEEFQTAWKEIADEVIEVAVEPIPLDQLCFPGDLAEGSITAHEFIVLGDLIAE
jgi:hypothetical protein